MRGKGSSLFGSRPHVHAGFLRSWHASGLHHKILERVERIAEEGAGNTRRQMSVYVTGEQAALTAPWSGTCWCIISPAGAQSQYGMHHMIKCDLTFVGHSLGGALVRCLCVCNRIPVAAMKIVWYAHL